MNSTKFNIENSKHDKVIQEQPLINKSDVNNNEHQVDADGSKYGCCGRTELYQSLR